METNAVSFQFQLIAQKMIREMRFVGIFYIIMGAFYCLSIIGLIFGIPIIFMGLRLREAADYFSLYLTGNDMNLLFQAFEKQERFFFINKVLIIVGIVAFVLMIIVYILIFAFLMSQFDDVMLT
jgi:hypothetical protein